MLQLVIDDENVKVIKDDLGGYKLGTVKNAFGNILAVLEQQFPFAVNSTPKAYSKYFISRFKNSLETNTAEKEILLYGLKCSAYYLFDINLFLSDSDRWCYISKRGIKQKGEYKINLTMQDVEIWRVHHNITKAVIPVDWNNVDYAKGLRIDNITSFYELFYGLLYYYAFNGLKLVKCEHCGRWFATDNFKNKYCHRNSTVEGYTHLVCEQAVRNLYQQIKRKRKVIYNSIINQEYNTKKYVEYEVIEREKETFIKKCNEYKSKLDEMATAEIITEYLTFLNSYRGEMKNGSN